MKTRQNIVIPAGVTTLLLCEFPSLVVYGSDEATITAEADQELAFKVTGQYLEIYYSDAYEAKLHVPHALALAIETPGDLGVYNMTGPIDLYVNEFSQGMLSGVCDLNITCVGGQLTVVDVTAKRVTVNTFAGVMFLDGHLGDFNLKAGGSAGVKVSGTATTANISARPLNQIVADGLKIETGE